MECASVVSITVICYMIGEIVKVSPLNDKWIPICMGVIGGILGVLGFYFIPGFPASDILNGIAVGIVSGLASTGANQIFKQIGK